jgi:hypothetical protein
MLVQELQELLEQYEPEAEVRFASQPSWPFEYSVAGAISSEELEADSRFNVVRLEAPADSEAAGWSWAVVDSRDDREPVFAPSEAEAAELLAEIEGNEGDRGPEDAPPAGVVYLVEGRQIAYASKRIFEVVQ